MPSHRAAAESPAGSYRRLADVFHALLSEHALDALLETIADTLADLVPYDALHIYEGDEAKLLRGERAEPEALITVPLVARESLKGALNIYRIGENASFDDGEVDLANRFGDAAALALDNAQIRARLEHQAQTDSLTGAYNHRHYHERLRAELNRASRASDTVAVLMYDIDDFKRVNDVYGHGEGDRLLIALADLTREAVRSSDVVCRIGGEEFAVIMPSCDAEAALGLARRIVEQVARTGFGPSGAVKLSIGLAQGPEHAMSPRELTACAEMAMMAAKARGGDRIVVFSNDALERPGAPRSSRDARSLADLKVLQSASAALSHLTEVHEIGEAVADQLRTLIDYHNCRVFLAKGETLRPIAFRGRFASEGDVEQGQLVGRIGEGITGRAAETGESLLVPNVLECDFALQVPGTPAIEESLLAVPMRYGGRTVGVVVVSKLGVGQFDDGDVRLVEVLAGHAAIALENAELYESQRRENESLERTFVSTMEALANALEATDEFESLHARWIRDAALTVGRELELDASAMKRLEYASLFHDIGKIGIPTDILLKPGPLTAEERALVETHAELGERILHPIERLADVRPIVRACHERWDGAGYPDRLAGEDIPIEARIVFVCDAFHAMVTDRPYRARCSVEEACQRLRDAAGTQFDPVVVAAFLAAEIAAAPDAVAA